MCNQVFSQFLFKGFRLWCLSISKNSSPGRQYNRLSRLMFLGLLLLFLHPSALGGNRRQKVEAAGK